mgnify:CR=1 FL=1
MGNRSDEMTHTRTHTHARRDTDIRQRSVELLAQILNALLLSHYRKNYIVQLHTNVLPSQPLHSWAPDSTTMSKCAHCADQAQQVDVTSRDALCVTLRRKSFPQSTTQELAHFLSHSPHLTSHPSSTHSPRGTPLVT